jgi:hypothetical protein
MHAFRTITYWCFQMKSWRILPIWNNTNVVIWTTPNSYLLFLRNILPHIQLLVHYNLRHWTHRFLLGWAQLLTLCVCPGAFTIVLCTVHWLHNNKIIVRAWHRTKPRFRVEHSKVLFIWCSLYVCVSWFCLRLRNVLKSIPCALIIIVTQIPLSLHGLIPQSVQYKPKSYHWVDFTMAASSIFAMYTRQSSDYAIAIPLYICCTISTKWFLCIIYICVLWSFYSYCGGQSH